MRYRIALAALLVFALLMPTKGFSECAYIQWSEGDFPPSAAHAKFISVSPDYTSFSYWIYPTGPGTRFIAVAIRSDKTAETAQAFFSWLKGDYESHYSFMGRVPELEDTAAEAVYAYRFVQGSGSGLNPGEVNFELIGQYKGNTTIMVGSPNNWDTPLVIPEQLHYDAFREAKRLVSQKCPSYRLEPFEADLEVGQSVAFVVKDAQNQTVKPSDITWSVIQQTSVSPFVSIRNTRIGTVDATGRFNGVGIGTCVVRAVTTDDDVLEANVTVRCPAGNGDLGRLRQIYTQRIPQGPIQKDLQEGTASWPFTVMNPGYATNLYATSDARYSNFTCGGYQGQVLQFLHTMQADPQECSILNGFEFGPIQGSMGGHHAVVVYTKGADWKTQGMVFDPWYHQRPESFSIDVWKQIFSPIAGDTSPSYRLDYPTTQDPSDFDTDVWRAAEALVQDLGQVAGVLDCPVNLLLRDGQGRRSGVDAGGTWHVEIPNTFFMRMPDGAGGYEWYFRLNGDISSYAMEIRGIGEGSFQLTTASPSTGSVYGYEAQQISTGKTASAALSSANPSPLLTTPSGGQITPNAIALPEGCWLVADDLGILVPRAALGGGYYTFRLDYSHDLLWELNLESLGTTGSGVSIPVGNDLSLPFSCAEFGGNQYSFTMRYDHGLFWRLDLQTLKAK
jgi:hypothetical protein